MMMNYKKLYAILCAAASEALDLLPDTPENAPARWTLAEALTRAEDVYLAQTEGEEGIRLE